MIHVCYGVLADFASKTIEGKLNIMGIFDTIRTSEIPSPPYNITLVLSVKAERGDCEREFPVIIRLIDADGNKKIELAGGVRFKEPQPGKHTISNVILYFNNINFEKFGDYEFDIIINGESKHKIPLSVVKGPIIIPGK